MDNTAFRDDAENGIQRLPLQELEENKLSEVDEVGDAGGARQRRVVPAEEAAETSPKEEEEEDYSLFSYFPQYPRYKARMAVLKQNEQLTLWVKGGLCLLLALLYGVYVISVVSIVSDIEIEDYWCNGDGLLLIITGVVAIFMLYFLVIKKFYGRQINNTVLKPLGKFISEYWSNRWVRLIVYLIPTVALLVFIIIDTAGDTSRLTSLFGTCCLIFAGFVFSHAPRKIIWRHVIWGLALQFIMGLMVLRWSVGRAVFQCAGDKVSAFLAYTDEGSKFVFGPLVDPMGIFGFQVLPVVLFFSFCIQILYYYGIMQWVVIKMGWLLQVTVGTTACESINAAANIFLGQRLPFSSNPTYQ
uniref:Solute carrier family 28 member 3-like n=1 Tax=Hirondellea gigas TaxID=1518452 RepID=A0A6A7FZT3_9CRUS